MNKYDVFLRWKLCLALVGAPVLWLIHFLLSYIYCEAMGRQNSSFASTNSVILPSAAILFALGALFISFRTLRFKQPTVNKENEILPNMGFLLGIFFSFILLFETSGTFFIKGGL